MSANGGNESLIFFDYLLYTTDIEPSTSSPPSTSSHQSVQAGAIAGGAIAGVALLVTIPAILFFLLRRHRPNRSHIRTGLPGAGLDVFHTDQTTPQMASASPRSRPLSVSEFSNAGTLPGPSLPDTAFASPSAPSLSSEAFESKHVAEPERTIERLRREMRSMSPFPGHEQETGSEAPATNQVRAGALQAMQAESDALRGLLSAMVDTESCGETLPRYEDSEARHSQRE